MSTTIATTDIPKSDIANAIKQWVQSPFVSYKYSEELIDGALDMFYTSRDSGYSMFTNKGLEVESNRVNEIVKNTLFKFIRRAAYQGSIGSKIYTDDSTSYKFQTLDKFTSFEAMFLESDDEDNPYYTNDAMMGLVEDYNITIEEEDDYINRVFPVGGKIDEKVRTYVRWLTRGSSPTAALSNMGITAFDYYIRKYNNIIIKQLEAMK